MARPPMIPSPPIDEPAMDLERVLSNQNLLAKTETYAIKQSRIHELVGEFNGRRKMASAIEKFCNALQLLDLQKLKDSKEYQGLNATDGSGKSVTITTFKEFCEIVVGRSYEAVNLDLKNLRSLGPDLFDAMRQVGFGPSTMRDCRAIPEDDKAALLEAAQTGDSDRLLDMAEALIAKQHRDKELLEQKAKNLEEARKRDKESHTRLLDQKNELTERLQRDIADLQGQIKDRLDAPPDWDRRVEQMNVDTGIMAGKILLQCDHLRSRLREIENMEYEEFREKQGLGKWSPPSRSMALQFLDKIEQVRNEVWILVTETLDAFAGCLELARGREFTALRELPEYTPGVYAERDPDSRPIGDLVAGTATYGRRQDDGSTLP